MHAGGVAHRWQVAEPQYSTQRSTYRRKRWNAFALPPLLQSSKPQVVAAQVVVALAA